MTVLAPHPQCGSHTHTHIHTGTHTRTGHTFCRSHATKGARSAPETGLTRE